MAIDNRVAVITGASGDLGRVVAKRLAEQGARLALFGRKAQRVEELAQELKLPPGRVLTGAYDLSDAAAARSAAEAVIKTFGRTDMLLHLVGGWNGGRTIVEVLGDDVAEMLQQHLWTTFHVAQAFVPHLVANHWGRIVVVSSPSAANPPAKGGPYSIGKAAEEALIATLAEELKDSGVTANVLRVRSIDVQPGRGTTPAEIAATILYLCSDEARVVNGARIPLYGHQ
jgi:NAD(P)-dependent dehydrogenase (short-subunit alcohol dehydrogenase family)